MFPKGNDMIYRVTATIVHHTTDLLGVSIDITKQIPSFLLDSDTQGIVDVEHAKKIAEKIICPVDLQYESVTVSIDVVDTGWNIETY
jgi:hypothetical protein